MGLGNRNARRHGANDSHSTYWQFKPGQRVMTVDGFAGVVASVEDGPHAGNEHYMVSLDNGMGGGAYQPGQLTALRQETAEHHTAGDDYPELSAILMDRPDIAPNQVMGSKTANASCPSCGTWTAMHEPGEQCPACSHQLAHESEGLLAPPAAAGDPQRVGFPHRGSHDHYMGTDECPEGEQPGFEEGHLTWGGQAAQGEGDDYSVLGVPRVGTTHIGRASCPGCGFYDGGMNGGSCPMCGTALEGSGVEPQQDPQQDSESCPSCGYYSGVALPHGDTCPMCHTPMPKHSSYRDAGPSCNCGLECPECGALDEGEEFANGQGHECASCGSNVWHGAECENCDSHEHGTSECPHPSYERVSPDSDYQGRDYSAEDPFAARRAMLESRLGGEFNGIHECDHCGSAAHSTAEHHSASEREDEDRDYGHECEYCGSEDHSTDDHQDEPQDDDAFIHGDGSASFGNKSLGRPPYGHEAPHEWAHHAVEQEMQHQGYYPNIWDENGNQCHGHHQEAVASELKRQHPYAGLSLPCPECGAGAEHQQDATGHDPGNGPQTDHVQRCTNCKLTYDPCEWQDEYAKHSMGDEHANYDPEEHAQQAVEEAFKGTSPAAHDLLVHNDQGPSRFSSLSVYSILVDAAADPEFRFEVTASWKDVRNKAKRLRTTGQVTITAASEGAITGVVKGDHFTYETQIQRLPGHFGVAVWQCGCKWAAYAWGRSPRYKHLEGRMCSHALALHYEAQSRGMFGREIYEDSVRPKWLRANSPIVVQYDKDRDRNETRRAVPPGNMRMTFGSVEQQGATKRQAMDEVTDAAQHNGHDDLNWQHTGEGHSHLFCNTCGLRSTIVDWPGHGWAPSHHMLGHPCIDEPEYDHGDYHETYGADDSRCPACGEHPDYCQGHGPSGDPTGHSILLNHEDGVHDDCDPRACPAAMERAVGFSGHHGPEYHDPDTINPGTRWEGPDYEHEDPFAPRRMKPEDTLDHIDRTLRGESALHIAVREAIAQGEDPADIALVMHTAMISKAGRFFHADQQYEDDSMASDGGAGGDNGWDGFSPTLDAGDPTTGQPAALSVQDYDETSAGYKDGSSSYNGGGIGSTGAVTDTGGIPQGAASPGMPMNSTDAQMNEDQSASGAEDDEHSSYAQDQVRYSTLNMDPEPALPTTDGADNDLEENPVVNSLAPNGGEDDRTASRHSSVQLHQDEEPVEDESAAELTDNAVAASLKTAACDLCDSTKHDTFGHYTATEGGDPEGREEERIEEENAALSGMPQDDYDTKYSSLKPNQTEDSLWAIVDQFQRSAAHLDPGTGESGNVGENDIAAAAREYLQKSALKDFTPAEQAALINEGAGVTAANLDRLSIEGTHYEALEAALAAEDSDPVGWLD